MGEAPRRQGATNDQPMTNDQAIAAPARPRSALTVGWLLSVFGIALTVRLVHVWQIRRAPFFSVLMGDSRSYDEWARRIAGGDWIGRDVFYQAPLYPYF